MRELVTPEGEAGDTTESQPTVGRLGRVGSCPGWRLEERVQRRPSWRLRRARGGGQSSQFKTEFLTLALDILAG